MDFNTYIDEADVAEKNDTEVRTTVPQSLKDDLLLLANLHGFPTGSDYLRHVLATHVYRDMRVLLIKIKHGSE